MSNFRPKLEDVPADIAFVTWVEPLERDGIERDGLERRFRKCSQRITRWICRGCNTVGRMYEGEPPEKCPKCGQKWTGP